MSDPRVAPYAELLVGRCLAVQPGSQLLVRAQPAARPLVEQIVRLVAERGAFAHLRLSYELPATLWARFAPERLLSEVPSIEAAEAAEADALISIQAPENTRESSDVPPGRLAPYQAARRPLYRAFEIDEKRWVICQFPTQALAQDAGMTLPEFEDFLYGAVLIDWDALERDMERVKRRFDAADEVRIVAEGTDVRLSLAGREGRISGAGRNMPSGEVFYSPVEDSAEGVVSFSEYPACRQGHQVEGVRLVFEAGRIVEASAASDEEYLLATLAADEGARRLGELGIGCNPGIQRHVRNTLFDEKMDGTVHLAVGQGFEQLGGTNTSVVHWDMVKDLRRGGSLYCDGELVQENGAWRL
ncbi:MAG: aminopeptidase [Gaiellaceae bacterium]